MQTAAMTRLSAARAIFRFTALSSCRQQDSGTGVRFTNACRGLLVTHPVCAPVVCQNAPFEVQVNRVMHWSFINLILKVPRAGKSTFKRVVRHIRVGPVLGVSA